MLIAALLSIIITALGTVSATGGSCKLNLQSQLNPHDEPLILDVNDTEDPELIPPQVENVGGKNQGIINVLEGKHLLVACTGRENAVKASGQPYSYAECSNGRLTINSKPATEENLSCTKGAANSWVDTTGKACGDEDHVGTLFNLGFKLDNDGHTTFLPVVEVCHNTDKMVTYYAKHKLYGASLSGAIKSSERRAFSPGPKGMGLFVGVSADKAYSQNGQKEKLDEILGKGASAEFISKDVFLSRGHLAPDADFIYHSGQLMTYYYINAAPQWQSFNAHNWLAVENTVRKLAAKERTTLNVWTGTYGVLKLNYKGNEKEIYLVTKESMKSKKLKKPKGPGKHGPKGPHGHGPKGPHKHGPKGPHEGGPKGKHGPKGPPKHGSNGPHKHGKPKGPEKYEHFENSHESDEESDEPTDSRLPVPEIYWKLVQHPTKELCIVAVGHNNVFLKTPPTPICDTHEVDGWPTLTKLKKGYVYYCDYESFSKTVSYVPYVKCTGLFSFN